MSIGSRDYIGSAGFLASARGGRAESPAEAASGELAPGGGVSTVDVLEQIYAAGAATVEQVTERLDTDATWVRAEMEKLRKLELVSCEERDNDQFYSLTDIGQRAREYGQIAKNSL
jgi:hypothetical protein